MQPKHVHLIGVAGTGMGALAGLLSRAGHRVTGSDSAFHPPMGQKLREWGVETRSGFRREHVADGPDLVVIGNVCRRDNEEAQAAIDAGLPYASLPATLEQFFLRERRNLVVAGTHGKTTTTALCAFLLHETGQNPGFLLGGVPKNFDDSFALGQSGGLFVVEGDEYDSAFFEKEPKFWRYRPHSAILTSIEHDHIDIYPRERDYLAAFQGFLSRLDPNGVLVAYAGDPHVRRLVEQAPCRVAFYALCDDDTGDIAPVWQAAPAATLAGSQPFDLFFGGSSCGRVYSPLSGAHNARNALAALALCVEAAGLGIDPLVRALRGFRGVRRRQDLVAVADSVTIYDDFAHHPTAVRETLRGIRHKHPSGQLIAIFEPRSATASRKLHQALYPSAFSSADRTLLAPVARGEIAEADRLNVAQVAADICRTLGPGRAEAPSDHATLVARALDYARPGDTVLVMSNGHFEGVLARLVAKLTARAVERGQMR